MDRAAKDAAIAMIKSDSELFQKRYLTLINIMKEQSQEVVEYFENMIEQIPTRISGPLLPKTPKVVRKKIVSRIETIREDSLSTAEDEKEDVPLRSRRAASQKATESIRKQQSETLITKLRRPSEDRPVRSKRAKNSNSSSDDDLHKRPSKISKMEEKKSTIKRLRQIKDEPISEPPTPEKTININETQKTISDPPRRSQRTSSKKSDSLSSAKKSNDRASAKKSNGLASAKKSNDPVSVKKPIVIDETMEIVDDDVTITEPSMYEDAVGKMLPMNSTMLNPNSTMTIARKMLNVTVVLEKVNDTRSLSQKNSLQSINGSRKNSVKEQEKTYTVVTPNEAAPSGSDKLKRKLQALKKQFQDANELITDDESSPERKNPKKFVTKKQKKAPVFLSSDEDDDDDDEVSPGTPQAELSKMKNKKKLKQSSKYKANPLFSPYAKESVKKKVEAFEQVVKTPGKTSVAVDVPTRVTRTKTRAMKAAEESDNDLPPPGPTTIAQKLARKSIAKAKKISITREKREHDEGKENALESAQKQSTRLQKLNDKILAKQKERVTPVKKSRLQMPMSVNKLHQTPAKQIQLPVRPLTASKVYNMGSSTESLTKASSKLGSTDSLSDKKKHVVVDEDDARWRKEEAMKQQSEEKRRRREEKELKNKLAREAKERVEQEKRLRLEKEREEKARAAQLALERAREEAEKKRQLQLQRAQEKEERRKYEEQMKQQRLQEQEEVERKLAEQKRREQEAAERRRLQEARSQQLAAAEKERAKQQLLAKAKMQEQQLKNNPNTYILDSDPDDDESDDESRPKHPIPQWAHSSIRKSHLQMQQNIPIEIALQFFGAKSCTPNLEELFVGIKKDRLVRTSSANWKSVPRFSMMED